MESSLPAETTMIVWAYAHMFSTVLSECTIRKYLIFCYNVMQKYGSAQGLPVKEVKVAFLVS